MVIIKGIIAIIFMVTLVAGMVFFVTRMEKIRKNDSFVEEIFYSVALIVLFMVFCVATVVFSISL